jgi:nucleotide-binding universal stress UspA family protein
MRTTRREVLAGAGMALLGSPLLAGTGAAHHAAGQGDLIVLQDPRLPLPEEVRRQLGANGASVIALASDPVRMWRGEQAALLGSRTTRLLGVTTWPTFLMVRGLSEESGRRVREQRLDTASGAMVWLIA